MDVGYPKVGERVQLGTRPTSTVNKQSKPMKDTGNPNSFRATGTCYYMFSVRTYEPETPYATEIYRDSLGLTMVGELVTPYSRQ